MENESELQAKQLLRFYFRRLFVAAEANWDPDAASDIERIVPLILDALDERVAVAVAKALLMGEGEIPERVMAEVHNFRLDSIERMTRAGGGFHLVMRSGDKLNLTKSEGQPLWDLLQAQSINLNDERKAE